MCDALSYPVLMIYQVQKPKKEGNKGYCTFEYQVLHADWTFSARRARCNNRRVTPGFQAASCDEANSRMTMENCRCSFDVRM